MQFPHCTRRTLSHFLCSFTMHECLRRKKRAQFRIPKRILTFEMIIYQSMQNKYEKSERERERKSGRSLICSNLSRDRWCVWQWNEVKCAGLAWRQVEIDFLTWLNFVVKCANGTRSTSFHPPGKHELSEKINSLKISSTLRTECESAKWASMLSLPCAKMSKDHRLNYFKFTYISANDKQFGARIPVFWANGK